MGLIIIFVIINYWTSDISIFKWNFVWKPNFNSIHKLPTIIIITCITIVHQIVALLLGFWKKTHTGRFLTTFLFHLTCWITWKSCRGRCETPCKIPDPYHKPLKRNFKIYSCISIDVLFGLVSGYDSSLICDPSNTVIWYILSSTRFLVSVSWVFPGQLPHDSENLKNSILILDNYVVDESDYCTWGILQMVEPTQAMVSITLPLLSTSERFIGLSTAKYLCKKSIKSLGILYL